MMNVSSNYLALWFILTRPGLVVCLDNGHLLKYDQEKACILYHNPNAKKQTGWYLARGAMQWAKKYGLASVDTYNWTLSPYSEEDMAMFLSEQGLTWRRP